MPLLPDDERLLHRALELARADAAFASPNPAVGCVLTRGGQTFGEGAHRYDLRDHAEIVALKDAAAQGYSIRGATAYVTLEPCSHHGRTGPCADALIAAGIARCIVATLDPNPDVRGKGLKKLSRAGVDVEVAEPASAIAQAARRLNDAFAFSIQHGRPFVMLKAAVSEDGKLAPAPAARTVAKQPHWLTGPAARADVQELRHHADALLTGIGTVLADDPGLTDRTGLPRRVPLLRAVLDSALRLPLDGKLLRTAKDDLLLFAAEDAPPERETALREAGVRVVRLPTIAGRLPLPAVLTHLASLGVRSVMVEAGSALNGSLLAAGLVDEIALYRAPVMLGPDALPFAQNQPSPEAFLCQMSGISRKTFAREHGEDIRLVGYLHDPWADI